MSLAHFRHLTAALCLAATLTGGPAHGAARPSRPVPTQPPPAVTTLPDTLTPEEGVCWALGVCTYNRATERDRGYSLLDVLQRTRSWDRTHGVLARVEQIHDAIITGLLQTPTLTPAQARRDVELSCMQGVQSQQTPTTSTGPTY